jgi:hypothetical protein
MILIALAPLPGLQGKNKKISYKLDVTWTEYNENYTTSYKYSLNHFLIVGMLSARSINFIRLMVNNTYFRSSRANRVW